MEVIDGRSFLGRTAHGWTLKMDVSIYAGTSYDCGCGKCHVFDALGSVVLRELPGMKLVVACPDNLALTCVKIKGLTKYAFESSFATADVGVAETLVQGQSELRLSESGGSPSAAYDGLATGHSKAAIILWCIGGVIYIAITGRLIGLTTVALIIPGIFVASVLSMITFFPGLFLRRKISATADYGWRNILLIYLGLAWKLVSFVSPIIAAIIYVKLARYLLSFL